MMLFIKKNNCCKSWDILGKKMRLPLLAFYILYNAGAKRIVNTVHVSLIIGKFL